MWWQHHRHEPVIIGVALATAPRQTVGMRRPVRARTGWTRVGWGLVAALAAVDLTSLGLRLALFHDPRTADVAGVGPTVRNIVAFEIAAVVGVLILRRHPGHAVGRVLLGVAVAFTLMLVVKSYARFAVLLHDGRPPGAIAAAWITEWSWAPVFALCGAIGLVFPDGRLPGRSWRWVGYGLVAGTVLVLLSLPFVPGQLAEGAGRVANPLAAPPALVPVVEAVSRVGYLLLLASLGLAAGSLIVRWRRGGAVQRQQLGWIALVVAALPPGLVALALAGNSPRWSPWIVLYRDLLTLALFVAIGIAVLRHRMFGIDVVINRAVAYGVLAAIVTAVYIVAAVAAGSVIGARSHAVVPSAIAAVAVALVLSPVRSWSHRFANRIVYGETKAPYEVLRDFAHQLAVAPPPEGLLPAVANAAASGVNALSGEVGLRLAYGPDEVARWPPTAPEGGATPDFRAPIRHDDVEIGWIAVTSRPGAALTRAQRHLLGTLAAQAAPALSNVRLTYQLQAQLETVCAQAAELRASRQRLATAQADERRRLERDLHDGAQQQLVAIAVRLRMAAAAVHRDPERAAAIMSETRANVTDTLKTLRDLARGVFPSLLEVGGLGTALSAHIRKTAAPVVLEDLLPPLERFGSDVELAVYFACLEAIQNVSKHAPQAGPATVRLEVADGALRFRITDHGPGFDPTTATGTGLQGITDRLAAVGGTVRLTTAPGEGTDLAGAVPVPVRR